MLFTLNKHANFRTVAPVALPVSWDERNVGPSDPFLLFSGPESTQMMGSCFVTGSSKARPLSSCHCLIPTLIQYSKASKYNHPITGAAVKITLSKHAQNTMYLLITLNCKKTKQKTLLYHYLALWTLKGVEDAKKEDKELRDWSKEGQKPGCPEEAAQAPHAEEGHAVLPPFVPVANLPEHQDKHRGAWKHHQHQEGQSGEVLGQPGTAIVFHPAPGNRKKTLRTGMKIVFVNLKKEKELTSDRNQRCLHSLPPLWHRKCPQLQPEYKQERQEELGNTESTVVSESFARSCDWMTSETHRSQQCSSNRALGWG